MKKKDRGTRAAQKILALERTKWNRYSIHDRRLVVKRIKLQHDHIQKQAAVIAEKGGFLLVPDLTSWLARAHNQYRRHIGATSKTYPRGIGKQARRLQESRLCAQQFN